MSSLPPSTLGVRSADAAEPSALELATLGIELQKLDNEKLKLVVEVWKKTVDVQQHFNDLELRIRNFALTLLVGVLGGTALALKEGRVPVNVGGFQMSLASALMLAGFVGWTGFWLLDRHWYHRLLVGAVAHGKKIEEAWGETLPVGLTKTIEENSHIPVKRRFTRILLVGVFSAVIGLLCLWGIHANRPNWIRWPYLVPGGTGAVVIGWYLRKVILPDWTFKARNRIDIFYLLMGLVLLTLAWVLRVMPAALPTP